MLKGDVAMRFLAAILERPKVKRLVSPAHFSVDGTLIEAWVSMKSFRRHGDDSSGGPPADGGSSDKQPDGRNGEVDFHGEKRSNATHASTIDPDAMLYRKTPGASAMLCYMGHVPMENATASSSMSKPPGSPAMPSGWRRSRWSKASPQRQARGA